MGSYPKAKARAKYTSFFGLPKEVMAHPNYLRLTSSAQRLINDLGYQYNGNNNGDLCAAFSIMQKRGWTSKATLQRAKECALHYGLIMVTRQGGRNLPTLYALTWKKIDECKGKLDEAETTVPPGTWKEERPDWKPKSGSRDKKSLVPKQGQLDPKTVPIDYATIKNWRLLTPKRGQSGGILRMTGTKTVPLYNLPGHSPRQAA